MKFSNTLRHTDPSALVGTQPFIALLSCYLKFSPAHSANMFMVLMLNAMLSEVCCFAATPAEFSTGVPIGFCFAAMKAVVVCVIH